MLPEFIQKIAGLTPPVYIMGGFAEDVILGQPMDRPHKDLDLLARRAAWEPTLAQLNAIGAGEWKLVLAGAAGQPLMFRGQAGSLELEIYVAEAQAHGGFSIEVPAQGSAGRLRLFLPPDTFSYPAVSIQTISPLALCRLRAASAQTRHTGEKQAKDREMVARLRQAFLPGYSDQELLPRIEAL